MNRLISGMVGLAQRRSRTVIAAWIVTLGIAAAFALQLDGALTAGGFNDPESESAHVDKVLQRVFDQQPNQDIVVLTGPEPVSRQTIDDASQILRDHGASTVTTPSENRALTSPDGKTSVLIAGFSGDNSKVQNRTPAIQSDLDRLDGATARLTGQPVLDYQLNVHSKEDATRAEIIAFPLLILVLLAVFRSVVATAVPLVLAGGALAGAQGVGYLATRFADISILYTNIVSMVGLAVAVDYSLFIVQRYREELRAGVGLDAALQRTFATAGRSVLFSGVAVTVALIGLFIPNLMAFTSIALGGIVVTLIALALTFTALPAALHLLGRRIEWGTIRLPKLPPARGTAAWSTRRGTSIVAGLIAASALVALAVPAAGISLQSPVASASILPTSDSARIGLKQARTAVGDSDLFPISVLITAPSSIPAQAFLDSVATQSDRISRNAEVRSVTSAISVTTLPLDEVAHVVDAGAAPAALRQLLTRSGGFWYGRLIVQAKDSPDTVATHRLIEELRGLDAGDGTGLTVTGATAQGLDFDHALERSIPWIVLLVFALSFVMLALAFRSIVLPVLALLFNALVVGASLGVLTLFVRATTDSPINSVTPVLLFAVLFGLSMDYMVVIVSRIIEEHRAHDDFARAVTIGTARTRAVVNSAAIIMVAVFASFTSAQISIVREIGIGLGVAVLLDALVIRMVVLPGVLRLIGPRSLPRTTPHSTNARNFGGVSTPIPASTTTGRSQVVEATWPSARRRVKSSRGVR